MTLPTIQKYESSKMSARARRAVAELYRQLVAGHSLRTIARDFQERDMPSEVQSAW
jgi:hypothetical protein